MNNLFYPIVFTITTLLLGLIFYLFPDKPQPKLTKKWFVAYYIFDTEYRTWDDSPHNIIIDKHPLTWIKEDFGDSSDNVRISWWKELTLKEIEL